MKIGRFHGIDVHIHWTFWVLILFYMISVSRSGGVVEGAIAVGFILGVFGCVLLHEFGHAAAAGWYGIPTRDITLLPIGGVARLESIPTKPVHELVVALAGPAVNVIIALLLLLPISVGMMSTISAPVFSLGTGLLVQLLGVNLLLAAFNLLPAFPMDGGRVLRSLLAMRLGHLRATQIAARIGRWMSLAFVVWAIISGNWMLFLLAIFIFGAGSSELLQVKMRALQAEAQLQMGQTQPWSYRPFAPDGVGPDSPFQSSGHPFQNADNDGVIDAVEVRQIR